MGKWENKRVGGNCKRAGGNSIRAVGTTDGMVGRTNGWGIQQMVVLGTGNGQLRTTNGLLGTANGLRNVFNCLPITGRTRIIITKAGDRYHHTKQKAPGGTTDCMQKRVAPGLSDGMVGRTDGW